MYSDILFRRREEQEQMYLFFLLIFFPPLQHFWLLSPEQELGVHYAEH